MLDTTMKRGVGAIGCCEPLREVAQLQIMYGLAGEKRLAEWEIPWLPGYEGSKPVRIGNAASDQLQIDVFGEVMDALHQARVGGLQHLEEGWDFQRALLSHLEKVWSSPDQGIWEVRRGPQHFTHSKVMAWLAFDRAIKSAEAFNLEGPIGRWRKIRAEIHEQVCEKAFNRNLGAYPGIWIKSARCKHAAHRTGRLPATQ
jgi:GH15 family glucan-1,4-alpha-glucosidase